MKRNVGLVLLLIVVLAAVACGDVESPDSAGQGIESLTADQQAKLSPDLVSILEEQGSADVLVQADPQAIFAQVVDPDVARELATDPAVIWKAKQEGAVIWKFTPEQAVIWKITTEKAVIWKLAENLSADGLPVEQTFESVHTLMLKANLATVIELARRDDVAYISPDREVAVSDLSTWNRAMGVDLLNTRQNGANFTGYTGNGVGVAVIDSGIKKTHADFNAANGSSRVVAGRNFTSEGNSTNINDNYGHGTHVAGIIAGNGKKSYDDHYTTTFEGVAPKANLIVAKVLDTNGAGTISGVLAAMEWVLSVKSQYNIRVVNMSLGLPAADPWRKDPLCQSVENAVARGLVVVVAAGNYGYYKGQLLYGSIASPGITPDAITVGAADTRGTTRRQQDANGHNDDVALFSSRGPTAWDGLAKPDLVAPGVDLISTYSSGSKLGQLYPQRIVDACTYGGANCGASNASYFKLSGTSMAAPMVAGAVALLLEGQPGLAPNAVKAVLMLSAQPLLEETSSAYCYNSNYDWRGDSNCLAQPAIEQGSGLLNLKGAADLALSVSVSPTLKPGDPWLLNTNIQPVTFYPSLNEQVIWGQGLAWTGGIIFGSDMWSVYQEAYQRGMIWGTGLAWTGGIMVGDDPVFNAPIKKIWSSSFINPYSVAGDNDVLGGYSYDWEGNPDFSSSSDAWFPEE